MSGLDDVPEDAVLEIAPLEEEALPELPSDGLALDGDLQIDDLALPELEAPEARLPEADTIAANAGDDPDEIVLKEQRVEDAHGEVVEVYQYFIYCYVRDDEYGLYDYLYRYRVLDDNSVRLIRFNYYLMREADTVSFPRTVGHYHVTEIWEYSAGIGGSNKIRSIIIPDTMKVIGECTFEQLRGLKYVSIPNSVKDIGNYAFTECDYMTSVTIPGSVKTLGNYAFDGCTIIENVTLNSGLETIGSYCFYNCAVTQITVPAP